MDDSLLSFKQVSPQRDLLEEIWKFDPRTIEQLDGVTISMYSIALAQFLIYYKSKYNETRVEIFRKKRVVDSGVNYSMSKEILDKYKTKGDAANAIIMESETLGLLQRDIDSMEDELKMLEGVDKAISEFIAVFKRELTRRENEMYQIRKSQ